VDASDLVRLSRLREQLRSGDAKRIRQAAKVSQSEMDDALGLPPSTVAYWERGNRMPRGERALAYAALLDRLEEQAVAS
jgi:DNA-binding transcriptional regulator YiaG